MAFISNTHEKQIFALHLRPNELKSQISVLIDSFDDIQSRVIRDPGVKASFWPLQQPVSFHVERDINQDQPASFYRIYFPLSKFLFGPALPAIRLDVRAAHCKRIESSVGMASFQSPWNGGFYHFPLKFVATLLASNSSRLQVNTLPPANSSLDPYIDLVLEPSCEYQFYLYYSLPHWFGQAS
ncbi:hypothetical protein Ciccas_013340 [Cichlidogyrus casuarinus]|uniref:Uncharacterized protein n=1 Tax=Cichlidogyrus casuarinus TaxID=1844966 RepID=A0ABD2PMA9_9PLAT